MNKFNDYQMHRMIDLLRLSFCIDQKNKYIPDTKVNDTPNNSTNNKISLEDYPNLKNKRNSLLLNYMIIK